MSSCLGIVLLAAKAMALSVHHRQNISELQKDSSQGQEKKTTYLFPHKVTYMYSEGGQKSEL